MPGPAWIARKGAQLVETLTGYLEAGGNYGAIAKALNVHRRTLRYQLQRVRARSGHDLADADTWFNLLLATLAWATVHALQQP